MLGTLEIPDVTMGGRGGRGEASGEEKKLTACV